MLPNPNDHPARFAQFRGDNPIVPPIGGDFSLPEQSVAFRHPAMPPAAMPVAAVHKYSDTLPKKDEIRFAEYGLMTTPTGNTMLAKHVHQP
jgi:hypothetical protein